MDIDAKEPIAGIRPALLKRLLQKERFETPTAMKWLRLEEPEITRKLCVLEREGWITFDGTDDAVDYWKPADKGQRLTATRLIKRIAIADGNRILGRLIEEARAINAESVCSRRIESILVFGSLLTGIPDSNIGDIDVVVTMKRRIAPASVLKAIEATEDASQPQGLSLVDSLHWTDRRLRRRLASVSAKTPDVLPQKSR